METSNKRDIKMVIRCDNYYTIKLMGTQYCGLFNMNHANTELKNIMELNPTFN